MESDLKSDGERREHFYEASPDALIDASNKNKQRNFIEAHCLHYPF